MRRLSTGISTRRESRPQASCKKRRERSGISVDLYFKMKKIHLVLDNCGIHKSKIAQRALEGFEGRIVLLFLHPCCAGENLIKLRWKIFYDNVTRNHRHKAILDLMGAVRRHLREFTREIKCAHAKVAA